MYLGWSTTKAGLVNTVKKKAMEIHLQSAFLYDMNLLHLDASKGRHAIHQPQVITAPPYSFHFPFLKKA
jgi:hypothetical protein